ncbi:putative uncharacterized protein DDB_G0282133 [Ctenocephalides felis]|uniref:putative uncharacterized protein DDB_G0282133 n=1 Tax=Ctenocephalides felis TaxID=7515 RepID=UPI000E6E4A60|nr:putative uncharacterized protein DDB_G0282133 [Ctenocephalides felis]
MTNLHSSVYCIGLRDNTQIELLTKQSEDGEKVIGIKETCMTNDNLNVDSNTENDGPCDNIVNKSVSISKECNSHNNDTSNIENNSSINSSISIQNNNRSAINTVVEQHDEKCGIECNKNCTSCLVKEEEYIKLTDENKYFESLDNSLECEHFSLIEQNDEQLISNENNYDIIASDSSDEEENVDPSLCDLNTKTNDKCKSVERDDNGEDELTIVNHHSNIHDEDKKSILDENTITQDQPIYSSTNTNINANANTNYNSALDKFENSKICNNIEIKSIDLDAKKSVDEHVSEVAQKDEQLVPKESNESHGERVYRQWSQWKREMMEINLDDNTNFTEDNMNLFLVKDGDTDNTTITNAKNLETNQLSKTKISIDDIIIPEINTIHEDDSNNESCNHSNLISSDDDVVHEVLTKCGINPSLFLNSSCTHDKSQCIQNCISTEHTREPDQTPNNCYPDCGQNITNDSLEEKLFGELFQEEAENVYDIEFKPTPAQIQWP